MSCRRCGADGPVYSNGYCKRCQRANSRDGRYGKGAGAWADAQEAQQDGKCAICGEIPSESLQLDHDHENGAWRGLICRTCNSMVGFLEKHHDRLDGVLAYLREW